MATIAEERSHPLVNVRPIPFAGWEAWKERWAREERFEFLLSLIHTGFDVRADSEDSYYDRICFYLELADSYPFYRLREENDWSGDKSNELKELREELSRKALAELVRHVFQPKEGHPPPWVYPAEDLRLLSKLLWFFRLGDHESLVNVGWDPGRGRESWVYGFAVGLAEHAWEYDTYDWGRSYVDPAVKQALHDARPQMIEILYGLRRLDTLLESNFIRDLDLACVLTLERLAMENTHHLPNLQGWRGDQVRSPRSIEEAWLGGSQPAKIFILLREHARISEETHRLQELAVKEREVREERERLTGTDAS